MPGKMAVWDLGRKWSGVTLQGTGGLQEEAAGRGDPTNHSCEGCNQKSAWITELSSSETCMLGKVMVGRRHILILKSHGGGLERSFAISWISIIYQV